MENFQLNRLGVDPMMDRQLRFLNRVLTQDGSAYEKIYRIIQLIYGFVRQDFVLVDNHHQKLWLPHTIRRLRAGIKVTLAHTLFTVLEFTILNDESPLHILRFFLVTFTIFYLTYLYTTHIKEFSQCRQLAICLIVLKMIVCFILSMFEHHPRTMAFVDGCLVLITLCLLMPIQNDVVLVLLTTYGVLDAVVDWLLASRNYSLLEFTPPFTTLYTFLTNLLTLIIFVVGGYHIRMWYAIRQRLTFFYLAHQVHHRMWIAYQNRAFEKFRSYFVPKGSIELSDEQSEGGEDPIEERPQKRIAFYPETVVLGMEIVGLYDLLAGRTMKEQGYRLNVVFSILDRCCAQQGLIKLRTLGSHYWAYMDPELPVTEQAPRAVSLMIDACHLIKCFGHLHKCVLRLRSAIDTGGLYLTQLGQYRPCVDGFADDWGRLNRLVTSTPPGRITITERIFQLVGKNFRFAQIPDPFDIPEDDETSELVAPRSEPRYIVDPKSDESSLKKYVNEDELKPHQCDLTYFLTTCIAKLPDQKSSSSMKSFRQHLLIRPIISDPFRVDCEFNEGQVTPQLKELRMEHRNLRCALEYLVTNTEQMDESVLLDYIRPPINHTTLRFTRPELERDYNKQTWHQGYSVYLLDLKHFAFCADISAVGAHNLLIFILILLRGVNDQTEKQWFIITLFFCFLVCFGIILCSLWLILAPIPSKLNEPSHVIKKSDRIRNRIIHHIYQTRMTCEIVMSLLIMLPIVELYLLVLWVSPEPFPSRLNETDTIMDAMPVFIHMSNILSTGSTFGVRLLTTIITAVALFVLKLIQPPESIFSMWGDAHIFGMLHACSILFLIWYAIRENDFTYRTLFFQRREVCSQWLNSETVTGENVRQMKSKIPTILVRQALAQLGPLAPRIEQSDLWFHSSLAFVSVIRVDGWSVEVNEDPIASIRLLNEAIHLLDALLQLEPFQRLFKLKSLGAEYIVVNNLFANQKNIEMGMVEMIEFCHTACTSVSSFNEEKDRHVDPITLTIGCHIGQLVGGVVGSSQLELNVWGEALEMALLLSRNKANSGRIWITDQVRTRLRYGYNFIPEGALETRWLNSVEIFVCERTV